MRRPLLDVLADELVVHLFEDPVAHLMLLYFANYVGVTCLNWFRHVLGRLESLELCLLFLGRDTNTSLDIGI